MKISEMLEEYLRMLDDMDQADWADLEAYAQHEIHMLEVEETILKQQQQEAKDG